MLEKNSKKKIHLSLDEELLSMIDAVSYDLKQTRTATINQALFGVFFSNASILSFLQNKSVSKN